MSTSLQNSLSSSSRAPGQQSHLSSSFARSPLFVFSTNSKLLILMLSCICLNLCSVRNGLIFFGIFNQKRVSCFFQRSKSISFREVLENASTENRTVIVTTLNQAWAEPNSLFDLFLESFRIGQGTQKLLQHVVVVCLDPKAFDRCSQLHPNCYYLETSGTDFSGEKLFATPDYLKMMWRRIELSHKCLKWDLTSSSRYSS